MNHGSTIAVGAVSRHRVVRSSSAILPLLAAALLLPLVGSVSFAQAPAADADAATVRALDVEGKRDWLRERMTASPPGMRRAAEIRNRLQRLDPAQLDQLVEAYFRQLAVAQANLRNRGRFGYSPYGYGGYRRPVGYAPVITWLPTGTSLQAGGVVSPDGRYVRVGAQPFFGNVPYYDTFNFTNGRTQRFYPQAQTPQRTNNNYRYYDGARTHYQPPRYERYHDGLRTHYRAIPR